MKYERFKLEEPLLSFVRNFNRDIQGNDINNALHETLHGEFTFYRNADMPEGEYIKELPKLCKNDIIHENWKPVITGKEDRGTFTFTKIGKPIAPFIYELVIFVEGKAIIGRKINEQDNYEILFRGWCTDVAQFRYLTTQLLNI